MGADPQLCLCISAVRKDVRVKRMYTGSMRITNQVFENAYENSNSTEFKALAKQVVSQVRLLHRHHLCNTHACVAFIVFLLNSVLLLYFPAQKHLFQKSSAGQILRGFHRSGFQVSEWSCRCLVCCSPLKSRRDEIAPFSPPSAKVALLPTTCLSSTSPQARRPPSTKPLPKWTSWWTRSSGAY